MTAALLARESKSLLIGERANSASSDSIMYIAEGLQSGYRANGLLIVHLAPDRILVVLSVEFADHFKTPQIEDAVVTIERQIRAPHPAGVSLFIKPQTAVTFESNVRKRYGNLLPDSGATGHDLEVDLP